MTNVLSHLHKARELLEKAEYNPFYGIRLVTLDETHVGGVCVCLSHAQIDPGKEITAHLHEHNGEICQAFSDITLYLGKPILHENGTYQLENDKVMVHWEEPIEMQSGDTVEIPEGVAHFFMNKDTAAVANIEFVIPKNHFMPDEKGSIDRKVAVRPPVQI